MKKIFSKPTSPPKQVIEPQAVTAEDIETQFSIIRMKNGQVMVRFPIKDAKNTVDLAAALELVVAGVHTLSQLIRQQEKEESRIAVVGPEMMPDPRLLKPQ